MKNDRQAKILELIARYEIDTQEALITKLAEEGYRVTQTTVSRDITQLKIVKGPTNHGTYRYMVPTAAEHPAVSSPAFNTAVSHAVRRVTAARNLVVIQTYAGMANAVAVCVESLAIAGIIGTLAGDDTILLVLADDESALRLEARLKALFTA